MPKDKKKTIKLTLLIIGLFLTGVFLSRGWVQKSFLPNQVSYFAEKSLEKSYEESYASLKQPFEKLQIELSASERLNVGERSDCNFYAAKGLMTSISCSVGTGGKLQVSESYITLFKQESSEAEKRVLENGWTKVRSSAQSISQLFDRSGKDEDMSVNYEKNYGKNTCKLEFGTQVYENRPQELHYAFYCIRQIHYFGNASQ